MSGRNEQALVLPSDVADSVLSVIATSPGGVCHLTNPEIGEKINRSRRTVGRALSDLLSRGLVVATPVLVTGPGQSGRALTIAVDGGETGSEEVSV